MDGQPRGFIELSRERSELLGEAMLARVELIVLMLAEGVEDASS